MSCMHDRRSKRKSHELNCIEEYPLLQSLGRLVQKRERQRRKGVMRTAFPRPRRTSISIHKERDGCWCVHPVLYTCGTL